jgi:hypothetical protein
VSRQEDKRLSMCERDALNENKRSYEDGARLRLRLRLRRDSRNLVLGVAMTRFVVKSSGETSLIRLNGVWFY